MNAQNIDIKISGGTCDAYVAYPGEDKYPAVILYMDAFGLRPYLFEMAQKLASYGYFVLMPNVFYRIKRSPVTDMKFPLKPEDMADISKVIMPLFQSFSVDKAVDDGAVYLDYLDGQKHVAKGKIGITGYCLGGGLSVRTAARYPDRVAAAASFHAGNLATEAPDSPHKLLNKIKAELYFGHADNDKSMPAEQIERLNKALSESPLRSKSEVYAGAAHGFTMMDLPAYNKEALERHWKNLSELLSRCL